MKEAPPQILRLDLTPAQLDILSGCYCYTLQCMGGDIAGALTTMKLISFFVQRHGEETVGIKDKLNTLLDTF
jgi:hypothetical protein